MYKKNIAFVVVMILLSTMMLSCTPTNQEADITSSPQPIIVTEVEDTTTPEPTAVKPFSEQKIDLIQTDGGFLQHLIQVIDKVYPLLDTIEEFGWDKGDGVYTITLYTEHYEYYVTLMADDLESKLDYSRCELTIENVQGGWILNNPTVERVQQKIFDPFEAELKNWKAIQPFEKRGNYINVYMCNKPSETIALDDKTVAEIMSMLEAATEHINASEYRDTGAAFYEHGIHIHLDALRSEFDSGIPVLVNAEGKKVIGAFNEESPVSSDAYETIINIVKANTDWYDVGVDQIHDLVSAELMYNNTSIAKITDVDALKSIEHKLTKAERVFGSTACPFGGKLILECSDGTKVEAWLATDGCPIMVLGSSAYYDHSKGSNEPALPSLFGYESFFDIQKSNS